VRLVIDTDILISALLAGNSLPAHLIVLWREGRFDLLTSVEQLDELMRVTRYPKFASVWPLPLPVALSMKFATLPSYSPSCRRPSPPRRTRMTIICWLRQP